jgi:hypothetical protein
MLKLLSLTLDVPLALGCILVAIKGILVPLAVAQERAAKAITAELIAKIINLFLASMMILLCGVGVQGESDPIRLVSFICFHPI